MVRTATKLPLMTTAMVTLLLVGCSRDSGPETAPGDPQAAGSQAESGLATLDPGEGAAQGLGWVGTETVILPDAELETVGIQTVDAKRRALAAWLPVMGRVLADQYRQAIVSYPFPARIAQIDARAGDWVKPGDALVVLQSEEVGEATSSFYRAGADFELAKVSFERESQLFENGVGARKNFTSAEADLQVAEANVNAAEKKLHVLGFSEEEIKLLQETHQINPIITLYAPIAGKVITNNAVLGGMVDESTEILTLMDLTRLWVEAELYEKDISAIQVGQRAEIQVPAYPEDTFEGTITYIGDVLDPETRSITVRTEVNNSGFKLKPGMFANLNIELHRNGTALTVPFEAVLDDQGAQFLFVRLGTHEFQPRLVTVGARENGFIEITAGLAEGETVVTNGNFQLKSKLYEAILKAGSVH